MAGETDLQIAHVLFMDVVGYSKLRTDQQRELSQRLNQIVRETEQFRRADEAGKLVRLPTGDGMVLVFLTSPDAPVRCAMEINRSVGQAFLPAENAGARQVGVLAPQLRIGIHSGPVDLIEDVNQHANVAGVGINIAQRVMDCGDAGHILLSRRVAEDLGQYTEWEPYLHELGEFEVKHGVVVNITNFYSGEVGNAAAPEKLRRLKALRMVRLRKQVAIALVVLALLGLSATVWLQRHHYFSSVPAMIEKSIAVLPFENLSSEKENAYFADGVQNEILTNLGKLADLTVISRTSVMVYKSGVARNVREIGQQLGVARILEGTVQAYAGKVRVSAQLVDTRADKQLWAQSYDRELKDVFAIESEIAQTIAGELQAKLTAPEKAALQEKPTQNLAAYDFYVRATKLIDLIYASQTVEKDLTTAVALLEQAIKLDPSFVLAYCRLAAAHDQFYFNGIDHTPARLALAKAAIDKAFQLKPDSGDAHFALGNHLYYGYFEHDKAEAELKIAQRSQPNNPDIYQLLGFINRRRDRWADALRNAQKASELDPRSVRRLLIVAGMAGFLGDNGTITATMKRVLELDPKNPQPRLELAGLHMSETADTGPYRKEIEKIMAEDPAKAEELGLASEYYRVAMFDRDFDAMERIVAKFPEKNPRGYDNGLDRNFWEGAVARMKGDNARAQAAFAASRLTQQKTLDAEPDNPAVLAGLAWIDAGLNRKDDALREGRAAIELASRKRDLLRGLVARGLFIYTCEWVGEKDLAIDLLLEESKKPGHAEDYGELRLSPFYDALRGDPRFEKLVASLAPTSTKP